jgi:hypothetical protein
MGGLGTPVFRRRPDIRCMPANYGNRKTVLMIPTVTTISRVLDDHRHLFDASLDEAALQERFTQIGEAILDSRSFPQPRWLVFQETGTSPSGKTRVYQVRSRENPHMMLGEVRWYAQFRCYAFYPSANTIFEPQCLTDITLFIEALMQARKIKTADPEG